MSTFETISKELLSAMKDSLVGCSGISLKIQRSRRVCQQSGIEKGAVGFRSGCRIDLKFRSPFRRAFEAKRVWSGIPARLHSLPALWRKDLPGRSASRWEYEPFPASL